MVKEPRAGLVKTRLARGIGVVPATQFYRTATAAVLSRVVREREWRTLLAVAPDAARSCRAWPMRTARVTQGRGDLGERMQRIFDRLPPGPVAIIGSDVPGIRAHHIRAAFAALGAHDAVLGPAPDGGYWLVGLRRRPTVPRAFRGVRWSGPHALDDTEMSLRGKRIARVATLADVDEAADWAIMGVIAGRRV